MGEEELQKAEVEKSAEEATSPAPAPAPAEPAKDVAEEKSMIAPSSDEKSMIAPSSEEKPDESKALTVVEDQVTEPPTGKSFSGATDRYALLARVETEKTLSLIKAWEENEKVKVENRAIKKMSSITSWENSRKATVEADLKKIEENLEKKKAEYREKMKNRIAIIHKEAEEKRAMTEAKRCEDIFKAEDMAAKYRQTGVTPKKALGWF